jgi:hypothetical protein|tara:strand:+ start:468 stop:662 length:195 start_codon:yes stop_codon:yes gene_type:complete
MDDSSNRTTKNEKITIEIDESTKGKTHAMAIELALTLSKQLEPWKRHVKGLRIKKNNKIFKKVS